MLKRARDAYQALGLMLPTQEQQRAILRQLIALRLAGRLAAYAAPADGELDFTPTWHHLDRALLEAGMFLELAEQWDNVTADRIDITISSICDDGWPEGELDRIADDLTDQVDTDGAAFVEFARTLRMED